MSSSLWGFSPGIRSSSIIVNPEVRTANSSKTCLHYYSLQKRNQDHLKRTFFHFSACTPPLELWEDSTTNTGCLRALLSLALSSFPELSTLPTSKTFFRQYIQNIQKKVLVRISKALTYMARPIAKGMFYLVNVIMPQHSFTDQSKLSHTASFCLTEKRGDADVMKCRSHAEISVCSWYALSLHTTLNIQFQQLFITLINYTLDSTHNLFLLLMRRILSDVNWGANWVLKIHWAGITPNISWCLARPPPPTPLPTPIFF